jgi:hypothetical protein
MPPSAIFHDLNSGRVTTINRTDEPRLREELGRAIVSSFKVRRAMLIGGGRFEVIADLTTVREEATTCFFVGAGAPLGGGRVSVGTILCCATTAYWLATAPEPYRFLIARYLSAVATAPPLTIWNSIGPMPRGVPWMCAFSTAEAAWLGREEKQLLWKLVGLIGLDLLERCERAAADAERDGRVPQLNTDRFPELADSEG